MLSDVFRLELSYFNKEGKEVTVTQFLHGKEVRDGRRDFLHDAFIAMRQELAKERAHT
jgi:hypothetical protein